MIVLAIETAGPRGGVALLRDEGAPRELVLEAARSVGAELAPSIKRLLREAGLGARTPDLVAVDVGPGSYTGLRIGIAAAKGLAFAWRCPLLGVSATDALAAAAGPEAERAVVALDASRGEVWAARYARREGALALEGEPGLCDPAALQGALPRPTLLLGDAWAQVVDPARGLLAPSTPRDWPTALDVARLARERHLAGQRQDPLRLAPVYYRANEAEEQRRKRGLRVQ